MSGILFICLHLSHETLLGGEAEAVNHTLKDSFYLELRNSTFS